MPVDASMKAATRRKVQLIQEVGHDGRCILRSDVWRKKVDRLKRERE